jgi:DNA-binding response OmpR family regulator
MIGRGRVLIVDDNVDAAESTARILRLNGFETRCAYDAESALKLGQTFDAQTFLLDVELPGMNGNELALQLRQDPAHAGSTFIALTGLSEDNLKRSKRSNGFDACLLKPAATQTLTDLIDRLQGSAH